MDLGQARREFASDAPPEGIWRHQALNACAGYDCLKTPLYVPSGFVGAAVCHGTHGHRCRDDDVGELIKKILARAAYALAGIEPACPDEGLCSLADLLGDLEDAHLHWHVAVVLMQ